jgi:hypothetical protein
MLELRGWGKMTGPERSFQRTTLSPLLSREVSFWRPTFDWSAGDLSPR